MKFVVVILLLVVVETTLVLADADHWTTWTHYTPCTETCGVSGIKKRFRTCVAPNQNCTGAAEQISQCKRVECKAVTECNCDCILTNSKGFINSRSIKKEAKACTWTINTRPGTKINLQIKDFLIEKGTLFIVGPERIYQKIIVETGTKIKVPFSIKSQSNLLNVTLYYDQTNFGDMMVLTGTYEAISSYVKKVVVTTTVATVANNHQEQGSNVNVAMIVGISACLFVVVLASFIIGFRKLRRMNTKNKDVSEEGVEDDYSSASSSGRTSRNKRPSPRKTRNSPAGLVQLQSRDLSPLRRDEIEQHRLITSPYDPAQRGYPDGTEVFIPANPNIMLAAGQAGYITQQPYVNWPLRQAYTDEYQQAQMTDFMIKQAQISYTPQVMYDQSRSHQYPTSGAEG